jgi:hypothetical protein
MVAQREIELPCREEAFQAVGQAIQAFSNIELTLSPPIRRGLALLADNLQAR